MSDMTLRQFSDKLQAFNPEKEADIVIKKNAPFMIDLIQGQMIRGRMPDDSQIGTYASSIYAHAKFIKSPLAGFGAMDFNLDGGYYKRMVVKGSYPKYSVISKDQKAGILMDIAGGDPLNFNKENQKKVTNKNDKDLIEAWRKKVGL